MVVLPLGAVLCVAAWTASLRTTFFYQFAIGHAVGVVSGCVAYTPNRQHALQGWHANPPSELTWLPILEKDELGVPLWIPFALMAGYATSTLVSTALRRRRLRRVGKCVRCGYDLTGNVSGVCPECGTKFESSK